MKPRHILLYDPIPYINISDDVVHVLLHSSMNSRTSTWSAPANTSNARINHNNEQKSEKSVSRLFLPLFSLSTFSLVLIILRLLPLWTEKGSSSLTRGINNIKPREKVFKATLSQLLGRPSFPPLFLTRRDGYKQCTTLPFDILGILQAPFDESVACFGLLD